VLKFELLLACCTLFVGQQSYIYRNNYTSVWTYDDWDTATLPVNTYTG